MNDSNTQSSQWQTKQIAVGTFEGTVRYKSEENEDGYILTHIVYSIIDKETGKHLAGIGNDWEEVSARMQQEVIEFQAHPE